MNIILYTIPTKEPERILPATINKASTFQARLSSLRNRQTKRSQAKARRALPGFRD